MGKIEVYYLLNEAGRKASLLAGGDGRRVQRLEIDSSPEWLGFAKVAEDGRATAFVGYVPSGKTVDPAWGDDKLVIGWEVMPSYESGDSGRPKTQPVRGLVEFNEPMTAEALFAWQSSCEVRLAAEKEAAEKEAAEKFASWQAEKEAKARAEAEKAAARTAARAEVVRRYNAGELKVVNGYIAGPGFDSIWHEHEDVFVETLRRRDVEREHKEAPAREWIAAFGSDRLKKIVAEGFLGTSMGLYRQERLGVERPGWMFAEYDVEDIRNPSEAAVDALVEAKKTDSDVELKFVCGTHAGCEPDCEEDCEGESFAVLVAEFLGKPIAKRV